MEDSDEMFRQFAYNLNARASAKRLRSEEEQHSKYFAKTNPSQATLPGAAASAAVATATAATSIVAVATSVATAIRPMSWQDARMQRMQHMSRIMAPRSASASDLSSQQRSTLYRLYYGPDTRIGKCVLCQEQSVVSDVEAGYDCAHVAPRVHGGESGEIWNYVPMCRSCNSATRARNMLDYVYQTHGDRLVWLCTRLREVYLPVACPDHDRYEQSLETFVREVYSEGPGISERGRIKQQKVYERLASYDRTLADCEQATGRFNENQVLIDDLQRQQGEAMDEADRLRERINLLKTRKGDLDGQLRQARLRKCELERVRNAKQQTLEKMQRK